MRNDKEKKMREANNSLKDVYDDDMREHLGMIWCAGKNFNNR